jgi:hypothetical protein
MAATQRNLHPGPPTTTLKRGGTDPAPLGTIVIRAGRVEASGRVGARRIIRSRYIKIRMEGLTGLRWMAYARWWWEKNKGPIPAGLMVLHRNGDSLDDSPENLFLGGPGDKIRLAHKLDPEMSRLNRESCREGTRRFNRLAGKLARIQRPTPCHWYPVVDDVMVVIDLPNRSRRRLLMALGADTSGLSRNGRGSAYAKAGEQVGVRLARGRDLGVGLLGNYLRIDPESGIGIGSRVRVDSLEIRQFMKTELWRRAESAVSTSGT